MKKVYIYILFFFLQITTVCLLVYLTYYFNFINLQHSLTQANLAQQITNLSQILLEMEVEKVVSGPFVKTYYEWFTENSHIIVPVFISLVCIGCIGIYFYYGKGNLPFSSGDAGTGTSSSGGSISTSENISTSAVQNTLMGSVEENNLSIVENVMLNIGIEENIITVTSVVKKISITNIQASESCTSGFTGPDLWTMFNHKTRDLYELYDIISSRLTTDDLFMWELEHMQRVYKITTLVKNGYYEKSVGVFINNITGTTPPASFFETDWIEALAKVIAISKRPEAANDGTVCPQSSIILAILKQIKTLENILLKGDYSTEIAAVVKFLKALSIM